MPSFTIVCGLCIRGGRRPNPIDVDARRKHLTSAHRYSDNDRSLDVLENNVFVYLDPEGHPADMLSEGLLHWIWEYGNESVKNLVSEYLSPNHRRTALNRTISSLEQARRECAEDEARDLIDYLLRRARTERDALDEATPSEGRT